MSLSFSLLLPPSTSLHLYNILSKDTHNCPLRLHTPLWSTRWLTPEFSRWEAKV